MSLLKKRGKEKEKNRKGSFFSLFIQRAEVGGSRGTGPTGRGARALPDQMGE